MTTALFEDNMKQQRLADVLDYGVATKYRSLLQNIVSFIGIFCKRDL